MPDFLAWCSSHFFADDLAAVLAGQMGIKYSKQCLDLEKKIKVFLDNLDYYCLLSVQPINYEKTEGLWSARAIGAAPFEIEREENIIKWCKEFKYLGYWISPKLGWENVIKKTMLKIRQRLARINSFKLESMLWVSLRRALFTSYILPLFTWPYPLFPLLKENQSKELSATLTLHV